MENEIYDQLNIRQNDEIIKATNIDPSEILYSDIIIKINKRGKRQERILLITKRALFNIIPDKPSLLSIIMSTFSKIFKIKSSNIRRIVLLDNIEAITLSSHYLSSEFILHVIGEFDYRFDGKNGIQDKRDKVLLAITKGLNFLKRKLRIILINNINLGDHTTSEEDSKKGISKIPKGKIIEVNQNDLATGVQFIIQRQNKQLSLLNLSLHAESFFFQRSIMSSQQIAKNKFFQSTNEMKLT